MADASHNQADEPLLPRVAALRFDAETVAARTARIHQLVLEQSGHMREGNFTSIATGDLVCLFDLYNVDFFGGLLKQLLQQRGTPLFFKLSRRMTSAGGKTYLYHRHGRPTHYEIGISTTLLYQTFADVQRTVRVNGLVCKDRLEALQRIFEHELLHLLELLVWGRSSCAESNFKALAGNIFAHSDTTHDLVTPRERAHAAHGIRPGDTVEFTHEGTRHRGIVNRITRRATVLVEDSRGIPHNDGKRYLKFYVPLTQLKKADG